MGEPLFPLGLKPKVHIMSDLVQEFGLSKFSTRILPWLLCRRYFFFSQTIETSSGVPRSVIPFHLTEMKEDDFKSLMQLRVGFHNPDIIRRRLREGHICFLGWSERSLIHARWIFVRSVYLPYLHRTLVLGPGEVYGDETYTVPKFRRQGFLLNAGFLVRERLKELGFRRITCAVASWDSFIQRYAERIHFEQVGEGGYLDLLVLKKFFWRGKVRELNKKEITVVSDE